MMSFEAFVNVQSGYLAYVLSPSSVATLLHHFEPKHDDVICNHITYKFPAKSTDPLPPDVHSAHVVGYEEEDGLEALVVEINGSTKRSDGSLFHITLSLDREKGKKPFHSNDMLKKGYKHIPSPISIHIEPEFIPH